MARPLLLMDGNTRRIGVQWSFGPCQTCVLILRQR